jgi:outer membrane protein assembly factor BamB
LRSGNRPRQGEYTVGVSFGHQLVVLHRDVVHFLAPVERRVLWTRAIDVGSGVGSDYRIAHAPKLEPLRSGAQVASRHALLTRAGQRGMLAAANSDYVCVYGRRQFTVLDAESGEVRWTCSDIPRNSTVFGNEDAVYIIPPDRSAAAAFRARDGKRLEVDKLGDLLVNAVAAVPGGIVTAEGLSSGILGLSGPRTVVQLIDPISGKTAWKLEYPGTTSLTLLGETRLVAVAGTGEVSLVDLDSGAVQTFDEKYPSVSLRERPDLFAVADRGRLFLFANRRRTRSVQYPEGFRSQPVDGCVAAYDLATSKLLWKNEALPAQHLVLDFLEDSPLLTFASRSLVRNREFGHWSFNLLVLDKQTGRKILETSDPSSSGFRTLEVNMAERYIEMRSYNQRVRLLAVDRARASAK